jgi:hypothetical protein
LQSIFILGKNGSILEFVFATHKTLICYIDILKTLKRTFLNIVLKQIYIHVDFEQAIYEAFRKVFPNAKLIGCEFHFFKNVSKKIKELKISKLMLEKDYKSKSNLEKKYEMFDDYSTCDNSTRKEFFDELDYLVRVNCTIEKWKHHLDRFKNKYTNLSIELMKYLDSNYFLENSRFNPKIWARSWFENEELPDKIDHTSSRVEGFHKNVWKLFDSKPTMKKFVEVIKILEHSQKQNKLNEFIYGSSSQISTRRKEISTQLGSKGPNYFEELVKKEHSKTNIAFFTTLPHKVIENISKFFEYPVVSKGKNLENHIIHYTLEFNSSGALKINSKVRSESENKEYEEFNQFYLSGNEIKLKSECTCLYGGNCKHSAAIILKLFSSKQ